MAGGRRLRLVVTAATAAVLLVGAGASACGPNEPEPQDQQPRGTARPTRTEPRPSSERHSDLDVADGLRPRAIDFTDSSTGYVLFSGCSGGCRGTLFVTFDGGSSWVERAVPADPFDNPDQLGMHVVDPKTVILTVGTTGWYRSVDSGRTFVRGPGTAPKPADMRRGVDVGCAAGGDCPASVLIDGVPTPAQPGLPGTLRGAVRAPGGPIWAVGADFTTAYTARSDDDGRTWQPIGGPLTVPGTNVLQVSVSLDGNDVWLLASGGPGAAAAYMMHPAGWREVNHEVRVSPGVAGGAAAGAGVLAVPGERFGFVFADGQYSEAARPNSAKSARVLPDGTLFVFVAAGDAWLGGGSGAARLWSRVTVDPI